MTERGRFLLLGGATLAAVWAAALVVSEGFTVSIAGVSLSSRDPFRPLGLSLLLLALYALAAGREGIRADAAALPAILTRLSAAAGLLAGRSRIRIRSDADALSAILTRLSAPAAALLALATLSLGLSFGTMAAVGADSYGYISQAHLWRQGTLILHEPFIAELPWPNPEWSASPLGYRPGQARNTIVPIYAPGLPILMAAFSVLGGCGPYLVPALGGALLVWLTFLLGRQLFGPVVGVAGAALVATSPVFFFNLVWPMADITAAALWTLALLLLLGERPATTAAGLIVSLAILVRPNLSPAAGVLAAWAVLHHRAGGRWSLRALKPALLFVAATVPGVAAIAAINAHLYGSPLASGYGGIAYLYSPVHVLHNLSNYAGWLLDKHTPIVLLAVVPLVWPGAAAWRSREAGLRLALAGFLAVFWLAYLFYFVFEAWWYLRFLLPTWPLMMVLAAAALEGIGRRLLGSFAVPLLAVLVVGLGIRGVVFDHEGVFGLFINEHRYVAAARYVAEHTEPDAVILSMQHSGSVRHYADRLTLRYDAIPREWLDRAVAWLAEQERPPYLLLESWEEEQFQKRFAGFSALASLDLAPVAELPHPMGIRLYDLTARDARTQVMPFPVAEECVTRPYLKQPR